MHKKLFQYLFLNFCAQTLAFLLNKKLLELGYLERLHPFQHDEVTFSYASKLFLLLIILAPIFEELAFRLFLVRNPQNLKIGGAFFLSIAVFKAISYFANLNIFVDYALQFTLAILVYLLLEQFIKTIRIPKIGFFNQHAFLIISSVIFGLFHIGIYYTSESASFKVISVLGFMFSGYLFGRFRIKYGIFNSIKLHASVNSLSFIAIIL